MTQRKATSTLMSSSPLPSSSLSLEQLAFSPSSGVFGDSIVHPIKSSAETLIEEPDQFLSDHQIRHLKAKDLKKLLRVKKLGDRGKKVTLQKRLIRYVQEKKTRLLEALTIEEASEVAEIRLEEKGSVYGCGRNDKHQLGIERTAGKQAYRLLTVIPCLKGKNIVQVDSSGDKSIALTKAGNVFLWGNRCEGMTEHRRMQKEESRRLCVEKSVWGTSCTGNSTGDVSAEELQYRQQNASVPVKLVYKLISEEVSSVSCSSNHFSAVTRDGDVYVWGENSQGELGTNPQRLARTDMLSPMLTNYFKKQEVFLVRQSLCRGSTTLVLAEMNGKRVQAYQWGRGMFTPIALTFAYDRFEVTRVFPKIPSTRTSGLSKVAIIKLAANVSHCAAISSIGVAFTWGSGDGGKLGHGDLKDRSHPTPVVTIQYIPVPTQKALDRKQDDGEQIVDLSLLNYPIAAIDVALGCFHSCFIYSFPPQVNCGRLFTCGVGCYGQLGHADVIELSLPRVCTELIRKSISVRRVKGGDLHSVTLTTQGELLSWGSNLYGQLGRKTDTKASLTDVQLEVKQEQGIFGYMAGVNRRVGRVGRGPVADFSCGIGFTIVAMKEYVGNSEEEEHADLVDSDDPQESNDQQPQQHQASSSELETPPLQRIILSNDAIKGNTCKQCNACPGFQSHLFQPNRCKECGCRNIVHQR